MPETDDPKISVGRETADISPADKPSEDGEGKGHPLPASGKARHGSIPETEEKRRGHGEN
jgi:hypothetical protein